jgi:hypothetical protein
MGPVLAASLPFSVTAQNHPPGRLGGQFGFAVPAVQGYIGAKWANCASGSQSRSIAAVKLLNAIIELANCRRKRIRIVANLSPKCIVHLSHSVGQML